MHNAVLSAVGRGLVQLPKDAEPGALHAGPPFELPYTLLLPDREVDRWRAHLDASKAALALSKKGDDLERLGALVDFELFRPELERAVPRADRRHQPQQGRLTQRPQRLCQPITLSAFEADLLADDEELACPGMRGAGEGDDR